MLKKAMFLVGLVAVLGMAMPEQASACEDCRVMLYCVIDECWLMDVCQPVRPLQPSFVNCTATSYFCYTSGEMCRWA